jgi:hypothetical protein
MSWKRAPLYTACHDVCLYLEAQAQRATQSEELADDVARRARELLVHVCLALTFPVHRKEHLRRVDESVVAVRALLRLQGDVGAASRGFVRMVAAQLDTIGRMVGGWVKASDARMQERQRGLRSPTPNKETGRERL